MSSTEIPARSIPVPTSISPEAQGFLAMGALSAGDDYPPLDDPEAWRRLIAEQDAMTAPFIIDQAAAAAVEMRIETIGGIAVNIATPAGADDDRVLLDIHGGALIFMGGEACTALTRLAASRSGLRTWGPDYRMAPDHPHPAPLDDCLAVYRSLLEQVPSDRIVIAGSSAGGNLAAALVVRAKDEGVQLPAALVLQTPEVDLTESGDTFATNLGVDPVLRPLRTVNELHAAGADLTHPYLSPLFAELTDFPPTMLTSGTRDLFLSNTVRMHRALRRAGCTAELHVFEAAPHGGFFGTAPEDAELFGEVRQFIDRHCPPSAR
jgi:monoterpene epsilon-lactone hydrolase